MTCRSIRMLWHFLRIIKTWQIWRIMQKDWWFFMNILWCQYFPSYHHQILHCNFALCCFESILSSSADRARAKRMFCLRFWICFQSPEVPVSVQFVQPRNLLPDFVFIFVHIKNRESSRFSIRMVIWIFCSDTLLFGDDEYFSCFNCYISKEWDGNAV